LKPKCNFC